MDQKWTKMNKKWTKFWIKNGQIMYLSKTDKKGTKNGPKMDQKWTKNIKKVAINC